jgi:hypothetical protein
VLEKLRRRHECEAIISRSGPAVEAVEGDGPATRYAPAGLVLVRPSGETLRFTCAEYLPGLANQIQGKYRVLERAEWEAQGAGYRCKMLGG